MPALKPQPKADKAMTLDLQALQPPSGTAIWPALPPADTDFVEPPNPWAPIQPQPVATQAPSQTSAGTTMTTQAAASSQPTAQQQRTTRSLAGNPFTVLQSQHTAISPSSATASSTRQVASVTVPSEIAQSFPATSVSIGFASSAVVSSSATQSFPATSASISFASSAVVSSSATQSFSSAIGLPSSAVVQSVATPSPAATSVSIGLPSSAVVQSITTQSPPATSVSVVSSSSAVMQSVATRSFPATSISIGSASSTVVQGVAAPSGTPAQLRCFTNAEGVKICYMADSQMHNTTDVHKEGGVNDYHQQWSGEKKQGVQGHIPGSNITGTLDHLGQNSSPDASKNGSTVFQGKQDSQKTYEHDIHKSNATFTDHETSSGVQDQDWKSSSKGADGSKQMSEFDKESDYNQASDTKVDSQGKDVLTTSSSHASNDHRLLSDAPGTAHDSNLMWSEDQSRKQQKEEFQGDGVYDLREESMAHDTIKAKVDGELGWAAFELDMKDFDAVFEEQAGWKKVMEGPEVLARRDEALQMPEGVEDGEWRPQIQDRDALAVRSAFDDLLVDQGSSADTLHSGDFAQSATRSVQGGARVLNAISDARNAYGTNGAPPSVAYLFALWALMGCCMVAGWILGKQLNGILRLSKRVRRGAREERSRQMAERVSGSV